MLKYFEDYLNEVKLHQRYYAPKNFNRKEGDQTSKFRASEDVVFVPTKTGIYLYNVSGGTDLYFDTPLLEITAPNIVKIVSKIGEIACQRPESFSDAEAMEMINFEMVLSAYYKVLVIGEELRIHNILSDKVELTFPMLSLVKYFRSRMEYKHKSFDTPDGHFDTSNIGIDVGWLGSLGHKVDESLSEKKARKSPKDDDTGLPKKYVSGLSDEEKEKRTKELKKKKNTKGKERYEPPKTDRGEKTKESKHTKKFKEKFGTSDDLENPSDDPIENIIELVKKEMPELDEKKLKEVVEEIKDRGAEAWVGGHRPGATQQQWYLARIYSFFTKGKTYYTTDRDQAEKLGLLEPED